MSLANEIREQQLHIAQLIEYIGDDPTRKGLEDTPKRVIQMHRELFRGYNSSQEPKVTSFPNDQDGLKVTTAVKDIGYFFSYCEHHMVPFFGYYAIGLIPNKLLPGASKFGRLVDFFSARLQTQERIGQQVADALEEALQPKGIIVILKARHLCKEMRGLRKWYSPFETEEVRGVYHTNENNCRTDFLLRIQGEI